MSVQGLFKWGLLLALLVLGVWLLVQPGALTPEGTARQQSLQRLASGTDRAIEGAAAETGATAAATVSLADIQPGSGGYEGLYERWMRGEVDLEVETILPPAEIEALREKAKSLAPSPDLPAVASAAPQVAPSLGLHFDSMDALTGRATPPDPELAAGPNHLIAVINVHFQIYNKSGSALTSPIDFASLFATDTSGAIGVNCKGNGPFDPNVLYDESADRFFMAVDGDGASYCMAVSKTGDPTKEWYLYEVPTNVNGYFFDYPHAGVGRDAIYMGANMFAGNTYAGSRVWAFEKSALYSGGSVSFVSRSTGYDNTPQPINLHGWNQGSWPSSGPHYILTGRVAGATGDPISVLNSWSDPFGSNTWKTIAAFDFQDTHSVDVGFPVKTILQKDGPSFSGLADHRPLDFEYRNGSGWTTMTVSCNPGGGTVNCVQWAQINLAAAKVTQAGVVRSNGEYRFYPDIASDNCGNALVGFTKSSSSMYPSISVAGRQAADPLNQMTGEVQIKAGETAYNASVYDRWGDYTGMTIDPDGNTFWYLGEYSKDYYYTIGNWGTYVGSLSFPDCGTPRPPLESEVFLPMVRQAPATVAPPPPPPSGPEAGYWQGAWNDFYVTPEGAAVDDFAIYIRVDGCGDYKIWHDPAEPIVNDSFSFSGAYYASGTFHSATSASGIAGLQSLEIPGCGFVSGSAPWEATWASSAQPAVRATIYAAPVVEPDSGAGIYLPMERDS